MSRQLPDVNVLLALVWPKHEAHQAAHAWFARAGQTSWATNPITQLGLVRLLTNPAVTQGAVNAAVAVGMMQQLTQHAAHQFWPLDKPVAAELEPMCARVRGHQQWTDALLLQQAIAHRAVLVSFDKGIQSLVTVENKKYLHILSAT